VKTISLIRRGLAPAALLALAATAMAATPSAAARRETTPCSPALSTAVIPPWGRAGFSDPRPRVTHVIGRSGAIMAILFGGRVLYSPPAADRNNKILWVARKRNDYGAMHISAQRMRGTAAIGKPVARIVSGGPGPSAIDLPADGCWRFTLTWSKFGLTSGPSFRDTLDLRYVKPAHK
jgi:hypothetical protein